MKTIVKIEMHPQNSCPLFSYPYACPHPSSTVLWNQNNPWFSYPYAISVLYSSTPILSRGTGLGVQRYENIVDDGTLRSTFFLKLGFRASKAGSIRCLKWSRCLRGSKLNEKRYWNHPTFPHFFSCMCTSFVHQKRGRYITRWWR